MNKGHPDHHDADLLLKVYDMRREAVLRASRSAINGQFWPKTYEDVQAVLKAEHPLNAAYRQVGTYWEMVYGFARHGIVNADFWIENNAEGFFLLAKATPFLERLRADVSPVVFRNAEWIAKECEEGRRAFERIVARVKKMAETR